MKAERTAKLANEVRDREEELWRLQMELAAAQEDERQLKELAEQREKDADSADAYAKVKAEAEALGRRSAGAGGADGDLAPAGPHRAARGQSPASSAPHQKADAPTSGR